MAVRAVRRSSLGKRSDYVWDEDSRGSTASVQDGDSSSCDESPFITRRKNKVRSVKSIRNLMKESNSYEKSDEHAYTQTTGCRGKRVRQDTESDISYERRVSKKTRCESKNAVNARINREKKKAYLTSLEDEVDQLRETNKDFSSKLHQQEATIGNLKQEVTHLQSLLANNKYLCALVSKLSEVTGLPVSSSLVSKMKQQDSPSPRTRCVPPGANHPIACRDVNLGSSDLDDFISSVVSDETETLFPIFDAENNFDFDTKDFLPLDYCSPDTSFSNEKNVGICVHINQNRLSVEFCAVCNARAMSA